MKTQSIRTFTRTKLEKIVKGQIRFKNILAVSDTNKMLAQYAQAYFFMKSDFVKSDAFAPFTNLTLVQGDDLVALNHIVAIDYASSLDGNHALKKEIQKNINEIVNSTKCTYYYIAKKLKTNQSNVSQFFKHDNFNSISLLKLKKLNKDLIKEFKSENED